MMKDPVLRGLLIWLLSLAVPAFAAEQPASVELPVKPTKVKVAVYVIDLIEIDGASQTFQADIAARFSWNDPRLAQAGAGVRRMPLEDVWHPGLLVVNRRSSDRSMPEVVEVSEDGEVLYRQRAISTFSVPLDLRKFPHDQQRLFVQVAGAGHELDEVELIVDQERSGSAESFSITDWKVGEISMRSGPYEIPQLGDKVPGLILEFEVTRLTRYYVGTIFATVAIIALMAWLVYWLPISAVNPRVSISVTSMLALIAYRFVASQDLPRLPYLTSMDHFLLGSALLILLGLVTVVAVAHEDSRGHARRAARLNLWFRWLYPVVLLALLFTLGIR